MSERVGIRKTYKKHFTLDEAKLRRIVDIVREHAKKLTDQTFLKFYVERENDAFYETRSIDEVLDDDNALGRSIRTLTIELHKEPTEENTGKPESERKPLVFVAFASFREEKVVFFIEEKDRDWCFLLADELDTQIKRVLKSVPLLLIPKEYIDMIVFFTLGGLILLYLMFLGLRVPPAFTLDQIKTMTTDERTVELLSLAVKQHSTSGLILPIFMLLYALVWGVIALRPIERILGKMSRSVFYWGDMAPIHDQFERKILHLKWGVCIAFVVSLAATIVGALLLKG